MDRAYQPEPARTQLRFRDAIHACREPFIERVWLGGVTTGARAEAAFARTRFNEGTIRLGEAVHGVQ